MAITKVSSGLISADASSIDLNIDAGTLYLDVSENRVGIGTTSPSEKLSINNASGNAYVQCTSGNGNLGGVWVGDQADEYVGAFLYDNNVDASLFYTNNAERMRIDSSGKVGIGDTSPSAKLEIKQGSGNWYEGIRINRSSNTTQFGTFSNNSGATFIGAADSAGGDNNAIIFGNSTNGTTFTERARISSDGKVGIGTTSPATLLTVGDFGDTARAATFHGGNILIDGGAASEIIIGDGNVAYMSIQTTDNATAMKIRNFSGSADLVTVERASGKVGIGLTNPADYYSDQLVVSAPGEGGITIASTATTHNNYLLFADGTSGDTAFRGQIAYAHGSDTMAVVSSGILKFEVGSSRPERMRIDSSGNLLVGGTNYGDSNSCSIASDGNIAVARASGSNRTMISFKNGGADVGLISTTNTATTYATSSDGRLKDITGSARGLEVINELNPVAYNWKADGKADEGLIAQEVLEIVPNAVSGSEEDMYQMDYSKLVVHLVAGMKEQQTIIDDLKTRIETLENA